MRLFTRIIQFIVGILFILSGLVKANDPLGLDYKMQEFFELWSLGLKDGHFFLRDPLIHLLSFLHGHSLMLSVVMITLEVVAGVALLTGWRKKLTLIFLLLLMIFFTFLTGYAYLSGKFTNCGCFGDCFPITPYASFIKDIVLTILVLILIFLSNHTLQLVRNSIRFGLVLAAILITVSVQWYILKTLPVADCLPFKKGNVIQDQMKSPPGSRPDSIEMRFVYTKGGKDFEFGMSELPADIDQYSFKKRIDKLIRKGNADPPIKGFLLTDSAGNDRTQEVLNMPGVILIFTQQANLITEWKEKLVLQKQSAEESQIPLFIVTSDPEQFRKQLDLLNIQVDVLSCDFTVIRTAARNEPTVYFIQQGKIIDKRYRGNMEQLKITRAR